MTSPIHTPLTLDEMIEALGSVLPAMQTTTINVGLWNDYYSQLTELLGDHGNEVLVWLKELRDLRIINK